MNQLVRGRTDLNGFVDWYELLSAEGQTELLHELFLCAQQAGGKEATFYAAVEAARLSKEEVLVESALSFRGDYSKSLNTTLHEWLIQCEEEERRSLFPLFVYYFAFAERAVYERETVECCNHWWHRDLLDPRVVRDLISNPDYFRTAMSDDIEIKMRDADKRRVQQNEGKK